MYVDILASIEYGILLLSNQQKFVSLVKKDVMVIEEQVNTAEKDLGTLTSVKNLIMSFPLFSQVRCYKTKYCQITGIHHCWRKNMVEMKQEETVVVLSCISV